jgi:rubrerythrin
MNVFDYAINMEEHAAQLFERLFDDTEDTELRRIFGLLAARERDCILHFATMKDSFSHDDANSTQLDRTRHVKDGFERLLEEHDILHELRTDPDGYEHIVKAEEENIRMLEGVAAVEPNRTARDLLSQFAAHKRNELSEIENIYDFVESPHTYLEWGEFSNLHPL